MNLKNRGRRPVKNHLMGKLPTIRSCPKKLKRGLTQTTPLGYFVSDAQRAPKNPSFIRGFNPHPLRRNAAVSTVLSKTRFEAPVPALHSLAPPGQFLPRCRASSVPALQHGCWAQADFRYPHLGVQPIFSTPSRADALSIRHDPQGFPARFASRRTERIDPPPRPTAAKNASASQGFHAFHPGPGLDRSSLIWLDDSGSTNRLQPAQTLSAFLSSAGLLRRPYPGQSSWSAPAGKLSCRGGSRSVLSALPRQTSCLYASQKNLGPASGRRRFLQWPFHPISRRFPDQLCHCGQADSSFEGPGHPASLSHLPPTSILAGRGAFLSSHGVDFASSIYSHPPAQTLPRRTHASAHALAIQGFLL